MPLLVPDDDDKELDSIVFSDLPSTRSFAQDAHDSSTGIEITKKAFKHHVAAVDSPRSVYRFVNHFGQSSKMTITKFLEVDRFMADGYLKSQTFLPYSTLPAKSGCFESTRWVGLILFRY
jgi:hypothetical protein